MKNKKTFGGLGMMSIVILAAFLTIVLMALVFGVFSELEAYQQLLAAMLSVAATGVITAILLSYQSKQQEELNAHQREFDAKTNAERREFEKQSNEQQRAFEEQARADQRRFESESKIKTKVFEEKLIIYKEFLNTLCEVVKDKKVDTDEEKRTLAINNFSSFLIPNEEIQKYEESNKKQRAEAYKNYKTIEERLQYLSGRLNVPCDRQWIYHGYVLVHEFNNDISEKTGRLVKGDNRIVVDLYMDEAIIQITLFTRQYDENESRKLVNGIWQGKVAYIPNDDKTRHVCADLPIETSDDEIVALMTKLLNEVKQYQVKKYELK